MSTEMANPSFKVNPKRMQLPKSETRFLKVHTRYKAQTQGFDLVPEIVLKGDWLKEFGFQCGELVKVCTAGPILQIIRTVTDNEKTRWEQLKS